MDRHPGSPPSPAPLDAWRICTIGAIGLAVAMGIGRFALTPLLPLMQREGLLGRTDGDWLAASNYVGYFLGSLVAARLAVRPRGLVLSCLFAIALLTAAVGLMHGLWKLVLLRGAAGVLSAWSLVGISSWGVGELIRARRIEASGWIFLGVGAGIAAAGFLVWAGSGLQSAVLWAALGAVALALALVVQRMWPAQAPMPADHASSKPTVGAPVRSAGLVFCYGSFGFGYILPATYLPVLARRLVDDPRLFGLAWPVFGLAAAVSTLAAGWALRRFRLLEVWAGCHLMMAAGCLLPLVSTSGPAIASSAVLVGGTFMVATMTGLQQARRMARADPAALLARMTAAFALGQIAGPLAVLLLSHVTLFQWSGIQLGMAIASALLCATAFWLHGSSAAMEAVHDEPAGADPERAK